jgi:hypothetical protein
MPEYKSVYHCTSNENGDEELRIERAGTVIGMMMSFFKTGNVGPSVVTDSYVMRGAQWVVKETGIIPKHEKQIELLYAKASLKHIKWATDF